MYASFLFCCYWISNTEIWSFSVNYNMIYGQCLFNVSRNCMCLVVGLLSWRWHVGGVTARSSRAPAELTNLYFVTLIQFYNDNKPETISTKVICLVSIRFACMKYIILFQTYIVTKLKDHYADDGIEKFSSFFCRALFDPYTTRELLSTAFPPQAPTGITDKTIILSTVRKQ